LRGLIESQSSNLSMLTGKTVRIESPTVEVSTAAELSADLPDEVIEVKIDFIEGLRGDHIYFLPLDIANRIASLMLGQEGVELDEMALSTIGEAISNIAGPATSTLGNQIGRPVQTDSPVNKRTPKNEISLPGGEGLVKVDYPLTIEGDMPSRLVEIYPVSLVKEVVSAMEGEPAEAVPGIDMGSPARNSGIAGKPTPGPGIGMQQTFGQALGGMSPMGQGPPPNVQPVQFANLQPTGGRIEQGNIGLLMDVYMEMTVELGRTKKLIKEILTIGEGTIIELDKLAGEPVDILVNHKLIAKGEVVVIDENFGVRVTEIVSPIERMGDLT